MLFKRFLIWSSGNLPVQWSRTIYAILKEGIMGNIHLKLCENLDQWFRRRYRLKTFLELWQPFCYAKRNHLCNFDRWYQEEKFCEIILNLDQCFRRRCVLKIFLIWSSGCPYIQRSRTNCAFLVEGIMRNNSVK